MVAVLACGTVAVLSHRSAGVLWRIVAKEGTAIDVSVERPAFVRRPNLVVHRRTRLWPTDVTRRNWILVTAPALTMVDLATELNLLDLERAVNDADKRNVIRVDPLRAALENYTGVPGVSVLRTLIDRLTFRLSDSELEVRFRPIARAASLPQPLSKHWVNEFEVDFYWPELGLIVRPTAPVSTGRRRRKLETRVATAPMCSQG